jgi:hypothetical protein
MRSIFVVALFALSLSANAIELVCKGNSQQNVQQRAVYVDCANRKAVIDALGGAWQTLRRERIGGNTEDMCWKPYKRAEGIHPSISFDGIAQTFFAECNMALQYVK